MGKTNARAKQLRSESGTWEVLTDAPMLVLPCSAGAKRFSLLPDAATKAAIEANTEKQLTCCLIAADNGTALWGGNPAPNTAMLIRRPDGTYLAGGRVTDFSEGISCYPGAAFCFLAGHYSWTADYWEEDS